MGQEKWAGKPYGEFALPGGKAKFKLCEQDYTEIKAITAKLMTYGNKTQPGQGPFLIDELKEATAQHRKNIWNGRETRPCRPSFPIWKSTTIRPWGWPSTRPRTRTPSGSRSEWSTSTSTPPRRSGAPPR